MSGLGHERIPDGNRIHLDSMVLIYFIQQNAAYLPVIKPIIGRITNGSIGAVSSCITLLEVLVKPIRERRPDLARRYEAMLTTSPNLILSPVYEDIAKIGAEIRATHDFKVADALQLATAMHHRARFFLTNDKQLKRFPDLEVLVLEELR